jgi:hypothetical protein
LPNGRTGPGLALLAALTLALGACGGGSDASPTPQAVATATPVRALELSRFHYLAELRLREARGARHQLVVTTEGDFQAPDRHAFTYTTRISDQELARSVVVIGGTMWYREGDGPWQETAPEDSELAEVLSAAFSPLRPNFLGGAEFASVRKSVERLAPTEELVDGVEAYRYRVGSAGIEYFAAFLADERFLQSVEDVSWDVWLARDGAWPVRLRASATVTADLKILEDLDLVAPVIWELQVDISQPNDLAVEVQTPR